jgi:Ca2+:H+ antiporter
MPLIFFALPLLAAAILGITFVTGSGLILNILSGAALIGAVLASVHHAEIIAHRVGEPFGTLVLALSVTIIEVALIISMMLLADGNEKATLTRDTIFSTIMIITNGVIGLSLLIGGIMHREQTFIVEGARPSLSILIALATFTLVLPVFTISAVEGEYTTAQLAFDAVASLLLWGVFVFGQTVRHRDYFSPPTLETDKDTHTSRPSTQAAWISFAFLLLSLISVVGLAKALSPSIEAGINDLGAPTNVIGIAIAMLVLLPESISAIRAAAANRLQTSMNLSLGSALASIGLTIPAVVLVSVLFDMPLMLGLDNKDLVMLLLTFIVSAITLGSGRTTMMQGAVHLVIFAAFLFLALVP